MTEFRVIATGLRFPEGPVAMPDGSESIRDTVSGAADDAQHLGEQLAGRLLEQGAGEILAALESAHG